jgi:hypothetical protein
MTSLDELSEGHLEMSVDMTRVGLGVWAGRGMVELHGIDHPRIHGGEIACLKGLQEGVGWSESEAFAAAVEVDDLSG